MAVMSLIQTLMYGSNVFNSDPYVWQSLIQNVWQYSLIQTLMYGSNMSLIQTLMYGSMSLIQTLMYGSNVFNSDPYVWQ